MTTKIITSQHYLDDDTIAAKRAAGDYTVMISPVFQVDGVSVAVVLDGHHSLAAAKLDNVEPEFVVASARDDDRVSLIEQDVNLFLEAAWMDGDYYDAINGGDVW